MSMLKQALLILSVVALNGSGSALAQDGDGFIEGFPDVPYINSIERIDGEPMVFDTPSGTVAEAIIFFSATATQVIESYQAALSGLGWNCQPDEVALMCNRDSAGVSFTFQSNTQTGSRFILRLEPQR